jgi:hypothetical protein
MIKCATETASTIGVYLVGFDAKESFGVKV